MRCFRAAFAVLLLWMLISAGFAEVASGHAQLESSSPAADSLISIPPRELILTFTEPVDIAAIAVAAVDEHGATVPLGAPAYRGGNDRQITVESTGFSIGSYTVTWTNRSATDGHTLSGSFAFRVGGTDRAPAAATVEGERPPAWSILTRWATFLGVAPAIGLLLVGWSIRRQRLVTVGALIAAAATVLEPVLLTLRPPSGSEAGSLFDALYAEPSGWWVRIAGLTALLAILAMANHLGNNPRRAVAAPGLVALAGLALTSHASGRESLSAPATAIAFVHNVSVAIWVGGLFLITLAPTLRRLPELASFSKRAIILVPVALATGLVNAAFVFPNVDTLTTTDYGRVLLVKVALAGAVLALAGWHHLRVRRADEATPGRLRPTMLAELAGIAIVVATAATLAMLAPPRAESGTLARLELAMPTSTEITDDQLFVRLTIDPARTGENRFITYATDGPPLTVELDDAGAPLRVDHPPVTDVQAMFIELESLDLAIAPRTIDLLPNGDGTFASDGVNLSAEGWWQLTVIVRRAEVAEDARAVFVVRTPDPNVEGFEEARSARSDPAAEAIYTGARDTLAAAEWAVYTEHLSGGNGGVEVSSQVWSNGGIWIRTPTLQLIRLDGQRYFKDQSEVWRVTGDSEPEGPTGWVQELDGATDFEPGNVVTLNGRQVQIIHFYVPGTILAPAYYTWWVDLETNQIEQIAMISRSHYMIKRFDWSVPPEPLVPPVAE